MAAEQAQAPSADIFDSYFRAADLDKDGRISGAEAVAFFQGSNLPKETLALVWSFAAGGNNSLGRMEFYNALRLVTVAQSGRQLTADIVKAALYGPAAAKIPAPKINPTSASARQMNSVATPAPQANQMSMQSAQTGFMRPPAFQINSMAASAPQANKIPQSAPTGFVRPPNSQMATAPLPQSSQSGFLRPPASQMNLIDTSSPQANNMLTGFMRPSPQINSAVTSAPQANNILPPLAHTGYTRPPVSQDTGFTGQQMPITTVLNHQGSPSPQNNFFRPLQASQVTASHSVQGFNQGLHAASTTISPGFPSSNSSALSTDWLAGRSGGPPGAVISPVFNDASFAEKDVFGIAHSTQETASKPQIKLVISSQAPSSPLDPVSTSFQTTSKESKALPVSGNGFSSDSVFGGDVFSAIRTKQDTSKPISSTSSSFNMTNVAPKNSVNPGQHPNLQGMTGLPPAADQLQSTQSLVKQNQLETMQRASALPVYSVPTGPESSVSSQTEVPWPKITQADIRKYTKVFLEVDKDRDGKITGSEARNLFLSWRLPRDVLRQVWDLSDQDNDSMLSMREFCVALYLMERYREGRPLPSVLPNSVKFDQTLILATGQLPSAYGTSAWQPRPVLSQQSIPESPSVVPHTWLEPSSRTPIPSQPDNVLSPVKQKPRVPVLEQSLVNQLSEEEQKTLNSKLQEATDADNKVQELEKEILDYKQKTENYRKQMQDLVLYKSRCDNRLNETIERVAADKREVELLARKYEEKYKQMGDVASKLTVDQATFRDIQERKMELYNAIAKMEQGEMSDGVLQERAEKMQTDLDELVKALNEWCKESGLRAKPTSLVELPFGWQPGIQEEASDWDENWDKFDKDNGYTIIKELTLEVENVVAPEKLKPTSVTGGKALTNGVPEVTQTSNTSDKATKDEELASFSNVDNKTDKSFAGQLLTEDGLSNVHDEDDPVRSPPRSPGRSTVESPSREFQSTFSLDAHAKEDSPGRSAMESPSREFQSTFSLHALAQEHRSEHESSNSGEKFSEEVRWGATFDSDDTDSIWGFNPIKTKEAVDDGSRSPFFDSVPSTPSLTNSAAFSPKFNEDHSFDSFSRFDSFSIHDSLFPSSGSTLTRFDSMHNDPSRDAFSRFDSFSSTADPHREFARFDSIRSSTIDPQREFARFDSIRSSTADPQREFARFDSIRSSTADPQREFARFDSIRSSTADYNHGGFSSFDDSDPFGYVGPFNTSETNTPKKSTTDHWRSF